MPQKKSGTTGESSKVSRRTVIQSVSGAAAGGLLASGVGAASTQEVEYTGISYDTLTHHHQGSATASVEFNDGKVSGSLSVGGFDISLADERLEEKEFGFKSLKVELTDQEYTTTREYRDEKIGLVADVDFYQGQMYGTMTRPSPNYGILGFTLADKATGVTQQGVMGGLSPLDVNVTIPREGIPQETGIANVGEDLMQSPSTTDDGDDDGKLTTESSVTTNSDRSVGTLEETSAWQDFSWSPNYDDCSRTINWKYALATTAEDDVNHSPYEVPAQGGNRYHIHSHFPEPPGNLFEPGDCWSASNYPTYPKRVNYHVENGYGESVADDTFEHPSPDAQSDDSTYDGLLNTSMDILSVAAGLTPTYYDDAAVAVIDFMVNQSQDESNMFSQDTADFDGDGEDEMYFDWDVELNGHEDDHDFPTAVGECGGVSFNMETYKGAGETVYFDTKSSFTFAYATLEDHASSCSSCDQVMYCLKTSLPIYNTCSVDVV